MGTTRIAGALVGLAALAARSPAEPPAQQAPPVFPVDVRLVDPRAELTQQIVPSDPPRSAVLD